ncbi:hypothetical protein [Bradyrhizobium lablabi]|uniref:hypothetical protein n=1 Tax=Bradyrhizobium lablabi TaxID=722472 RepID=UPI002012F50C|nr:hypothetical protein [Bradyrhizobium lablabi]
MSLYNAMIAASALQAGRDTLWSEDMQHGMRLEQRLRVANLFRVCVERTGLADLMHCHRNSPDAFRRHQGSHSTQFLFRSSFDVTSSQVRCALLRSRSNSSFPLSRFGAITIRPFLAASIFRLEAPLCFKSSS